MGHLGLYKGLLMGVKGLRVKELHEAYFTSNTGLGFIVNWKWSYKNLKKLLTL